MEADKKEEKKEEKPKGKAKGEKPKEENKDNKTKKEVNKPPRKENEFIIHYILSPKEKRQEKYDKELKMFEKKLQMTEMMEAEMRKKMMERREGLDFDLFGKIDQNESRKEKEKNEQRRKKEKNKNLY